MSLSWSILLLSLPIVFGLGWLASRLDWTQLRMQERNAKREYFKGLGHLLDSQQDQAIDVFVDAVQHDPDTTELHFALGNLFRRRGEYDRAIKIHEHLLARADLSSTERDRARYALAQDYVKTGLLDRAETALKDLYGSPYEAQALWALLSMYERSRDWAHASTAIERLEQLDQGSFAVRRAHYACEQAQDALNRLQQQDKQSDPSFVSEVHALQQSVQTLLAQASRAAPDHPRWRSLSIQRALQSGQASVAWDLCTQACAQTPSALPIWAQLSARVAKHAGQENACIAMLQAHLQQAGCLDVLLALIQLDPPNTQAYCTQYLHKQSSLVAASLQLQAQPSSNPVLEATSNSVPEQNNVRKALDLATQPLLRYRCAACGFSAKKHFWQCLGCQAWDSMPYRRIEEL